MNGCHAAGRTAPRFEPMGLSMTPRPSIASEADAPAARLAAKAGAAGSQDILVRGATAIIPQKLISEGEVVLLAIKPSLWFILLISGRWLIACALIVVASELLRPVVPDQLARRVEQLAILLGSVRVVAGALEWLGRVYVLTDRRVMRLKGVIHIDLFECHLSRIQQTVLALPASERLLCCGTILFYTAGTDRADAAWETVAHPAPVYQTVLEAMDRYRRQNP